MKPTTKPIYSLGGRVRELREKRNMTQLELATAIGMRREDLVRLETESRPSNPTFARIVAIAEALGVDAADLLPKRNRPAA